ncbi:MAG: GNAT family N-acetyltransferase [Proteobacteria bacterium]|nr:MAG: GNAT family N-acetyltransferase [Pseudomonadota bacterium]
MSKFNTRFLALGDKTEWRELFNGYADFYEVAMNDRIAETVWEWLVDSRHVMEGLITRDERGQAVGIAHIRACPRTLGGAEIGFLDDLFVTPSARGTGAATAIFEALDDLAAERNWPSIRWLTQHFNKRGRAFYDRYTNGPTDLIVYQWDRQ